MAHWTIEQKSDTLCHIGTPDQSGRYKRGSGKNPQHHLDILARDKALKAMKGPDGKPLYTELERAKLMGFKSTNDLRAAKTIAKNAKVRHEIDMCQKLSAKGMSNVAIGERLGIGESLVRQRLAQANEEKQKQTNLNAAADILANAVNSQGPIDVGKGVERHMGVSEQTKNVAVKMLEQQGYTVINLYVKQLSTGQRTTQQVLCPPGMTYKELKDNMDQIGDLVTDEYLANNGSDKFKLHRPNNVDGSRVHVRYDEDGGTERDGTIELRRGVKDLDMGNSRYAQVRIGVDGEYYLKGMAVYGDDKDFPPGCDIIFNSNKKRGTPLERVFKPQNKDNPDNPFAASIDRQNDWTDSDGNVHEGALNIVREEGKWGEWKKSIASQVLSKQSTDLAQKQLDLAYRQHLEEFEQIQSVTNPVLRQKLLVDFGDQCDKDAVNLKAAAFPRQASQVILPVPSLKPTEIYAPRYQDGEEVCLIRYPHGGIFEIPRLKVNNRNKEADRMIGKDALDAVGINSKTAEQLSGADFDGDTVLVIPTKTIKLQNKPALEGLIGFDPKASYPGKDSKGNPLPGVKLITKQQTSDQEMGKITNLITDMTLQDAPDDEIVRAVKHSMVVIDAKKHGLDYKRSFEENGIAALKKKYQLDPVTGSSGAGTLISRAKNEYRVDKVDPRYEIDPKTGEKIFRPAKDLYYEQTRTLKDGTVVTETLKRQDKTTKMAAAKDARTLIGRDNEMEYIYADYANQMKSLGNKARLESLKAEKQIGKRDASAVATYKEEVQSIKTKLATSEMNAPLERKAQRIANMRYNAVLEDNPNMEDEEKKKARNLQLRKAREETGATRYKIRLTEREWEACQSNAVAPSVQKTLFQKMEQDDLMKLALPKEKKGLSSAQINSAKAMLNAGYTIAEVAEHYGISSSTLAANIKPKA